MSASINKVPDWIKQQEQWNTLGNGAGVAVEFNTLTIKALYVTGIMLNSFVSVSILLRRENIISTTYYPAYVVFASAIELLGRCIRGNNTLRKNTEDLEIGFKWLAEPSVDGYQKVTNDHILAETVNYKYPISDLVSLRNFAAHGQAINKSSLGEIDEFDYLLLGEMPPVVARGVENYLFELRSNEDLCNRLAQASITPYRGRPIFDSLWELHKTDNSYPSSVGDFIKKQDWKIS